MEAGHSRVKLRGSVNKQGLWEVGFVVITRWCLLTREYMIALFE